MSSVSLGTDHTVAPITPIITDEEQEENDVINSENRHSYADDIALFEHLPDNDHLLRRALLVEEEDGDTDFDRDLHAMPALLVEEEDGDIALDRDLHAMPMSFGDPDEVDLKEAEERRLLEEE